MIGGYETKSSQSIIKHENVVAEASGHYKQVEDFMAAEVFVSAVEDGQF